MADKLFGTDGVRGVANVFPMVPDFAMKLAMACAVTICTNHHKVAIAKDTRISGDMLEAALIAGFTASGVEVVSLGVLPTPALTMLTPELKVDMSVMITASHNPYHDNGIKLIGADGNKLSDAQTSRIETLVAENAFTLNPDALGRVQIDNTAVARYEQKIKSLFQGSPLKNMKIVLDCANGAFAAFAPELLRSLGAEVIAIGNNPDGSNINMGCGSTATQLMQETVVSTNSDMGIALDGDGDRIIVCDEKGNRLDGDQILAFVATYLQQHNRLKANSVVATVWSNLGLEKYLQTLGIKYFRTAVGERHVTEKMREIESNFGGEESGHMVQFDFGPTGDGLVTGITMAAGILQSGKKMSQIFPVFEKCPCEIKNLRFPNKDIIAKILDDAIVQQVIDESAKMAQSAGGSVIVRKSGTEPLIKVRVEAENLEVVKLAADKIITKISEFM